MAASTAGALTLSERAASPSWKPRSLGSSLSWAPRGSPRCWSLRLLPIGHSFSLTPCACSDDSYSPDSPELRAMFVQEVGQDAALDLLQIERRCIFTV